MSTSGGLPSPIRSPLKSIGASSFSPSPMTTSAVHRHRVEQQAHGVDGGAVGGLLLPLPTQRAAARAAASVTRTSSRARLRSGLVPERWSCESTLTRRRLVGGDQTVPGALRVRRGPLSIERVKPTTEIAIAHSSAIQ